MFLSCHIATLCKGLVHHGKHDFEITVDPFRDEKYKIIVFLEINETI